MQRPVMLGLLLGVQILGLSTAAAQATRTWVSGVGDDVNPCSRTAPCKTFAGAISKTAAGGEISVLDPGGFGAVTITKAITIDGNGTVAGILSAGTNGVNVSVGASDMVVLRNLSINGAGTGVNGIRFLSGGTLVVQNVDLSAFTTSGIVVTAPGGALIVDDVRITKAARGLFIDTNASPARLDVSLDRVSIRQTVNALDVIRGLTSVANSTFTANSGIALYAQGGSISVENSMITSNGIATQVQSGGTIRLSNTGVYNNLSGFVCNGGSLASAGDNRKAGNMGGSAVPCSPTSLITLQ